MEKEDILFYSGSCPLCEKQMNEIWGYGETIYECLNKCYQVLRSTRNIRENNEYYCWDISICDSFHTFEENDLNGGIKVVTNSIKYWKENERYLIKILEGN